MKNLCSIGVRGGSKGVKNKNLKLMNDKPLLAYTIEQAKESGLFEHIVLSTDSEEIQELALSLGADSWFLRPSEMATDEAGKLPVIAHTLKESEKYYSLKFDVIVDLDVTAPLRTSEDIEKAYLKLIEKDADNLISVCESRKNPYFNMIEVHNDIPKVVKKIKNRPVSRQEAPKVFDMNAAIYMWQRRSKIDYENLISDKTVLYEMPQERSVDIDSETDWNFVEFMLKKGRKKNA